MVKDREAWHAAVHGGRKEIDVTWRLNNTYSFNWLHWVLVAAHKILSCSMQTLSWGRWDLSFLARNQTQASCIGNAES